MLARRSSNQAGRISADEGQPDSVSSARGPQGWGLATTSEHVRRAVEYLEARGLSPEIADRAGIYPVVNAKVVHPAFKKKAGLIIPYIDPWTNEPSTYSDDGSVKNFLRVRYLTPEAPNGLARKAKPQRFSQPAGSPVFAYFAPGGFVDWPSTLSDPNIPIVFGEGGIKGLCACAHGIPTIALGGVYNFRNRGAFLPELERVEWRGRRTIICYDSDTSEKPQVQAAERHLASELKKRGAIVHVARLPNADDGSKLGLDDFIARFKVERTQKLLLDAPELSSFEVVIDIAPHRLLENLEQLDEAFAASDIPIFQRSGEVVHVTVALGPKQTLQFYPLMSAFGGEADIDVKGPRRYPPVPSCMGMGIHADC